MDAPGNMNILNKFEYIHQIIDGRINVNIHNEYLCNENSFSSSNFQIFATPTPPPRPPHFLYYFEILV